MKILYVSRRFQVRAVRTSAPGDVHADPAWGECRRLTAKRFCLMAERAGKDSEAVPALLSAILAAAEHGVYDGRAVEDWYGLAGLSPPEEELRPVECPECGAWHFALHSAGGVWNGGVCCVCRGKCFHSPDFFGKTG